MRYEYNIICDTNRHKYTKIMNITFDVNWGNFASLWAWSIGRDANNTFNFSPPNLASMVIQDTNVLGIVWGHGEGPTELIPYHQRLQNSPCMGFWPTLLYFLAKNRVKNRVILGNREYLEIRSNDFCYIGLRVGSHIDCRITTDGLYPKIFIWEFWGLQNAHRFTLFVKFNKNRVK